MADSLEIASRETLEFMSRQVGGRQYLGFIHDDYKELFMFQTNKRGS